VQTKEWNASAMGNGAIWVYTGILDEMTDDEMAIVLGHELAHFSHEHSRRSRKRGMWTSIVGLGAVVASSTLDNDGARIAAMSGSMLGMTAFSSGYSRDLEDQADRVGLRYAHEAGYDVRKGPVLWGKFRKKYGERDSVTNFFVGSHSRPSDRIRNIERELRTNYRTAG
jgi:Zn-dependent protease with chaperone function